jgi:hypothetical protein
MRDVLRCAIREDPDNRRRNGHGVRCMFDCHAIPVELDAGIHTGIARAGRDEISLTHMDPDIGRRLPAGVEPRGSRDPGCDRILRARKVMEIVAQPFIPNATARWHRLSLVELRGTAAAQPVPPVIR